MDEKYVKRRYLSLSKPGALSAKYGFLLNSKYQDKTAIQEILSQLHTYNVHRPVRRRFQRRPVICITKDYLWQSDLIDYQKYKHSNSGISFILLIVDWFTKFLWSVPIKKKTPHNVLDGFASVLKQSKRKPQLLLTDRGQEFYGKVFLNFLVSKGIKLYSTHSILKASIAERYVRTVKT